MRVDHVSYAAEPDGSVATARRLADRLGVEPVAGGVGMGNARVEVEAAADEVTGYVGEDGLGRVSQRWAW